jgi:hypothetical protein
MKKPEVRSLLILSVLSPFAREKGLSLSPFHLTNTGLQYATLLPTAGAGIFKQSIGVRNRVGIALSYRPARLIGWWN